ncbi:molybdopterin-dependent oxidoreductase [Acidimangrovimonas sediminis]|uniref:molybdopterin-dependent oxidoreductase n=1 Tax=Acidimangrovimonas sediminis TaxID=2056283 RepID=UPI001E618614|nr:molybdopterin-dependent oxidoreductase [Acidimangrovimonas sediminis]
MSRPCHRTGPVDPSRPPIPAEARGRAEGAHDRVHGPGAPTLAVLALVAGLAAGTLATRAAAGPGEVAAGEAGPGAQMPRGKVLLTVDGAIARHNVGRAERLDLAMLRALPQRRVVTTTIWTNGPQVFQGVLLGDLLRWLGVPQGAVIVAHGTNDYETRIPVSEASDPGPIIAYRRNGAPMRLRDNGPLWLVYPYDADPRWQTEVVYAHSIWQLDHMTIVAGPTAN